MLSFTASPTHFLVSPSSFIGLRPQTWAFTPFQGGSRTGSRRNQGKFESLHFVAVKEMKRKGYGDFGWGFGGGFLRRCKKSWELEGDFALEAEILEFMENSENPEKFPSKKELIDAGRMDLIESILKQGGWLTFGWEDDSENEKVEVFDNVEEIDLEFLRNKVEWDNRMVQERSLDENEKWSSAVSCLPLDPYTSASSSGRSLDTAADDDSGIEGILSRLEKERYMKFGFDVIDKGDTAHLDTNSIKLDWPAKTLKNSTVAGLKRNLPHASLYPNNTMINNSGSKLGNGKSIPNIDGYQNSPKPNTWRAWSIQRAGFSNMEFEADEIGSRESRMKGEMVALGDEILETDEGSGASLNQRTENGYHKVINHNQIRTRLQHLESELSCVLQTLKTNTTESVSQKGHEVSSDDLLKLSDAWEFQENEIMNARDKLRSIRAKLAVLEGKMALAIIDAQKIVEDKQKTIDDARRALRLLRTACIVWPNPASEVLLAGSFDGWATQRKMERSHTGIFSLYLKLYPGRYEIKFIVDGEWKIDPLRPIVNNNGYENNLLIIT